MTTVTVVAVPLFVRPAWYDRANCQGVGPAMFYVDKGISTAAAQNICHECEVREECLNFAVVRGEPFGMWGGLSARQRSRIRTSRRVRRR